MNYFNSLQRKIDSLFHIHSNPNHGGEEEREFNDEVNKLNKLMQERNNNSNNTRGEMVNHPSHYQDKSGFECVDEARFHDFDTGNSLKYLWRLGQKQENGMTSKEKEIEDTRKAIWYLTDRFNSLTTYPQRKPNEEFLETKPYHIREAIKQIWDCGVPISPLQTREEANKLSIAIEHLTEHLNTLEQ